MRWSTFTVAAICLLAMAIASPAARAGGFAEPSGSMTAAAKTDAVGSIDHSRKKVRAAQQDDPDVPAYSIQVSDDGQSLNIDGGIRFGLLDDIKTAMLSAPQIRTIILTSPGGRLGAAQDVALFIRQHGLNTYVPASCLSACTRIFVAGQKRTLLDGAKLGFHGAAFTEDMPIRGVMTWLANQVSVSEYAADGVDKAFMLHAVAVPSKDIWYPTVPELFAAHVITAVAGNDDGPYTPAEPVAAAWPPPPGPPPAARL